MIHHETIEAKLASESGQEGRFDVIESGGSFSVFDQEVGLYAAQGLKTQRGAVAKARRLAKVYDARIRAERKAAKAKPKFDLSVAKANMLDLSTGHVSERDREILGDCYESAPRVQPHQYGWIVYVSSDPEFIKEAAHNLRERGHSKGFIDLYKSAASAPEAYILINFDRDATAIEGLPYFD